MLTSPGTQTYRALRHVLALLLAFIICLYPAHHVSAAFLVASDYRGNMKRINPETRAIIDTIPGFNGAAELEYDGDTLLYASSYQWGHVKIINVISGQHTGTISLPGNPRDVTFGPNGDLYIAVASDNQGIYRYNTQTQQLSALYNTSILAEAPVGIAFHTNGELYLASYLTSHLTRINSETGEVLGTFADTGISTPQSVAFGPDGRVYVANQRSGNITQYDPNGGYLGILVSDIPNPQGLLFLPDGSLLWGNGKSEFTRYDFDTHTNAPFSTGYSFAHSLALIPEPATCTMLFLASTMLLKRNRNN